MYVLVHAEFRIFSCWIKLSWGLLWHHGKFATNSSSFFITQQCYVLSVSVLFYSLLTLFVPLQSTVAILELVTM